MHFLLLCGWGVCIGLSFLGYGTFFLWLLGITKAAPSLAAAIGVSLVTILGGFLNLFGVVLPPVLVSLVLLGLILFFLFPKSLLSQIPSLYEEVAKAGRKRLITWLAAAVMALLTIQVFGNVAPDYFNKIDDLDAYLVFPAAMLQTGTLPSDPFCERRVVAGLGGAYFLQTFMLVTGDVRTIRFIDWGLGTVIYCGLIYAIGRRLGLSSAWSILATALVFVTPLSRMNATMVVLPAALFCALFLVQMDSTMGKMDDWRRTLLVALLVAAICPLKSTYLPAAILIFVSYHCCILLRGFSRRFVVTGMLAAILVCILLSPWLVDMKRKEGSYLFPVFGRGYDASAYGIIPLPNGVHSGMHLTPSMLAAVLPPALPFLIAAVAFPLTCRRWAGRQGALLTGTLMSAGVAILAVGVSSGGESVGRFTKPFGIPALLMLVLFLLRHWRSSFPRSSGFKALALFTAAWVIAVSLYYGVHGRDYVTYLADLGISHLEPEARLDVAEEQHRTSAMQSLVPPGATLLEHLNVSCFFDFRRNRIYNADHPGMASLPPGMPIGQGPETLRAYLLRQSIHYVAYTYKPDLFTYLTPKKSLSELLASKGDEGRHYWVYLQFAVSSDVQSNLNRLARAYKSMYDDGHSRLLDLSRPAEQHS